MIKEVAVLKTGRVPPAEPLLVRFLGLSRSHPLPSAHGNSFSAVGETNHPAILVQNTREIYHDHHVLICRYNFTDWQKRN